MTWRVKADEPQGTWFWTGTGWTQDSERARAYVRRQDALRAAGCLNRGAARGTQAPAVAVQS